MSDVRVEGLNLRLNRDKQGHGNWEDIGKNAPEAATDTPTPVPATAPVTEVKAEKPPQPIRLDIDSLTINNARIEYNDEQTGKQFSAESIQLSAGAIHEGASIPLKLTAFLGSNQPVMRVKTELNGNLRIQRALKRYQFEDMRFSGEATGEPLQGKTVTFSTQGQLLVDLAANIAEWTNLKLSANQLRALGELKVNDLDKTPQLSGALSIAQFDLAKFLDSVGNPLPPMAEGSLSKVELVSPPPRHADPPGPGRPQPETRRQHLHRPRCRGRFRQAIAARATQGRHLQRRQLPAGQVRVRQGGNRRTPGRSAEQRSRRHGRRWHHTAAGRPRPKAPGAPTSCCR